MRRPLFTLLLAGSLAVGGAVAAPALSTDPYIPEPVEFELAPTGPDAGQEVGGDVVSRPLDAPKRFDLVGLRWQEGSPRPEVELRVRREGEAWSGWADAAPEGEHGPDPGRGEAAAKRVSEPVWANGADEVQYRTSERLRGLKVEFINTTGTATAADRAETAVRKAANKGVAGVASLFTARGASQPSMVTRSQWGASRCGPRRRSDSGSVKAVFVHHTVTANGYSRSDGPSMVLGICRWHVNNNGWDDIGYNFLVDKYGQIYEGRNGGVTRANVGAQAQGWNAQSTGIANIGDHSRSGQSSSGLRAMDRLITWKLGVHKTPLGGRVTLVSAGGPLNRYPAGRRVSFNRISGHRDGNKTECPGNALYAQLPRLRRAVESGGDTTPPATPRDLVARSGPGNVALNWDNNGESDLAGYRVYRRTNDTSYAPIATTRSSSFTDDTVRGGVVYFYRVAAYDKSDNQSPWSNYVVGRPTVPWEQIVDNSDAQRFTASSNWGTSNRTSGHRGANYRFARPVTESDVARFRLRVPEAGRYAVYVWHPQHPDYSSSAPIGVRTDDGTDWSRHDLRSNGGRWVQLGTYSLAAGEEPRVLFSRWTSAAGWLIADAVRIVER
jgi:N-acetylmuramoyl-L-alanine amidase